MVVKVVAATRRQSRALGCVSVCPCLVRFGAFMNAATDETSRRSNQRCRTRRSWWKQRRKKCDGNIRIVRIFRIFSSRIVRDQQRTDSNYISQRIRFGFVFITPWIFGPTTTATTGRRPSSASLSHRAFAVGGWNLSQRQWHWQWLIGWPGLDCWPTTTARQSQIGTTETSPYTQQHYHYHHHQQHYHHGQAGQTEIASSGFCRQLPTGPAGPVDSADPTDNQTRPSPSIGCPADLPTSTTSASTILSTSSVCFGFGFSTQRQFAVRLSGARLVVDRIARSESSSSRKATFCPIVSQPRDGKQNQQPTDSAFVQRATSPVTIVVRRRSGRPPTASAFSSCWSGWLSMDAQFSAGQRVEEPRKFTESAFEQWDVQSDISSQSRSSGRPSTATASPSAAAASGSSRSFRLRCNSSTPLAAQLFQRFPAGSHSGAGSITFVHTQPVVPPSGSPAHGRLANQQRNPHAGKETRPLRRHYASPREIRSGTVGLAVRCDRRDRRDRRVRLAVTETAYLPSVSLAFLLIDV